ncbi:cytochrome P450 [Streptomyces sp. RSD-27]|nr:cytochrome P450 [Streptomyces sp. RSD-27]
MSLLPSPGRCPYQLDGSAADIHGEAAVLRAMGPAARVELPGGVPAWSVTDPGLIRRLLVHPRISKDAHQHWPAFLDGDLPADWPLRVWVDIRTVQTAYGPDHSRLRQLLVPTFASRRVRALAPWLEEATGALLDELAVAAAAAPDGVVDLRRHFAERLPWRTVTALLGLPENMQRGFQGINDTVFMTNLPAEQVAANTAAAERLLRALIALKTEQPGDDVSTALVQAHHRGRLTERELADSLWMMMGAGYGTTANLLDHAVVSLLTHPAQLDLAMAGRVGWDRVVEETLRHQAPVASFMMRFPTEDLYDEASGLTFLRGDAIVINYAAAGRDLEVHGSDAGLFDITRATTRDHVAFSHGQTYCLGAELARLEGRIALKALFSRFPALELAVGADRLVPLPSLLFNGHQEVPVRLEGSPR